MEDYFKKYLDESFGNLNRRIDELEKTGKQTLHQSLLTNGNVRELQQWRATSQGHWNGVTKTVTIIASATGAVLGILAAYLFRS